MLQSKDNNYYLQRIKTLKLNLNPKNYIVKQRVRNMFIFLFFNLNRVLLQ